MSMRRRIIPLIVLTTVLTVFVALVAAGFLTYYLWLVPRGLHIRCQYNLRIILAESTDNYIRTPEGKRLFSDYVGMSDSNYFEGEMDPPDPWICPACDEFYVYSPVSPSGDRIELGPGGGARLVTWCPGECHYGKRLFLWGDGATLLLHDSEVSWYYQKEADDLSPEERARENEYRKKKGLPLLR